MVVPEENTLFTRQYNPNYAWDTGCQFVCMYYQKIDDNMDYYVTKFKNTSFIPKPKNLREENKPYVRKIEHNTLSKEDQNNKVLANCPMEPNSRNRNINDIGDQIKFKNTNDNEGVCFIGNNCNNSYKVINKSINWVVKDEDKNILPFETSNKNMNVGIDKDGNMYNDFNPQLCCSKEENIQINDKYILSPNCNNKNNNGTVGLKVSSSDAKNTPFKIGNKDGKYKWVHPKLCKVNSNNDLKENPFCLISQNTCPKSWNTSDIKLENNWNLCCKNMN